MQTLFFAIEKPSYPTSVEQQSSTCTSINIIWKVGYDGNSPILSYKIEMKEAIKSWNAGNYFIVDGNKTFYTIRNLRPGTRYSFRISARNKHGSSGESREYNFTTKEEGKYKLTRKLLLCIKRICNTLRKMCPYLEFFWFVFSRIQTEYGEIRSQGLIQKKKLTSVAPKAGWVL